MDAKSKAEFINSVASGKIIPCPKCGTSNNTGSKFCISCGEDLSSSNEKKSNTPAFAPAKETPAKKYKYTEPDNLFAKGLPAWSIEPPQLPVRRR